MNKGRLKIYLGYAAGVGKTYQMLEEAQTLKAKRIDIVIGYFELMTSVQRIYSVNFQTIPLLIVAAIWYLALTSVLSIGQGFVERRYGRGVHRGPTGARLLPRRRTAGAK